MNCPHLLHRITLILFVLVAGVSAQSVTFNVARAEMHCPLSDKQRVRVLLDTSVKGHLDPHQFTGGYDCATEPEPDRAPTTPHPCKAYWAVANLFEDSLTKLEADPVDSTKKAHLYILELDSGTRRYLKTEFDIETILTKPPLTRENPDASHLTLEFSTLETIDPSKSHVLIANIQKLADGKPEANSHMTKLEPTQSCSQLPKELKPPPTKEQEEQERIDKEKKEDVAHYLVESSKSKGANVGVSFGLKGSKKNYIYTHDIALRIGRLHRLGLGGAYDINWFFLDHKFSSDENSPLDDLKFGIKANHLLLFDPYSSRNRRPERDLFNSLATTISGHIETDFRFSDQVNFLAEWQTGLPINLFDERSTVMRITPFVGYGMGYRIKDETPIGKNKFISRGMFGMNVYFAPFRREKVNPLEFELDVIRRALFREEPEYRIDDEGNEIFVGFNRRPKDFAKARLTFNYNNTFAPFIQYSYGQTPGKYILQNHAIEAGLKVYLKWAK